MLRSNLGCGDNRLQGWQLPLGQGRRNSGRGPKSCCVKVVRPQSGKQTAFAVRPIRWQTSEHPNITSSRARS